VGESPYILTLASSGNHSGWIKDIERSARLTFETLDKKYNNPVGHFTYAVRCQAEKPSAKEINACAPNLIAEILECSVPEKPICIFVMGATGLKALGIQFKKYMEVIGKTIETTIEGRRAFVFVSLSKRQLVTKAGYSEILTRQVEVFLEMVKKNMEGTLEDQRTILARLSEKYRYPKTVQELDTLVTDILRETTDKTPISIDTETNSLYPHRSKLKLLMVSVSWGTGRSAAIQLEHPESVLKLEDARPHLERLFSSSRYKVFANAKYDLKVLERKGFKIRRLSWDVMLGEHLIEEDKKGFYGLKSITRLRLPEFAAYEDELKEIYAKRMDNDSLVPAPVTEEDEEKLLLKRVKPKRKKKVKAEGPKLSRLEKKLAEDDGFQAIPLRDLLQYAAFDTDVTLRIAAQQRKELTNESRKLEKKRLEFLGSTSANSRNIGETLCPIPNPPQYNMSARIIPTTRVLAKMELHGMAVDREYILQLQIAMDSYLASSSAIFSDMLPVGFADFNPASTQHVAKALFSTGYLQPGTGALVCYAGKIEPPRTEKGAISTDAKFLKFLATTHKCALSTALLEFRGISKARSTFIENIEVLSREDGRMHSNFHQHGTATNRLCVSKNTILETSLGSYKIPEVDVTKKPKIISHTGKWQTITDLTYKGRDSMFRVTLRNKSKIEVTAAHRFLTPTGYKHLYNLHPSHEVMTYQDGLFVANRIASIRPLGVMDVWDIQVEEDHSYVAHGFVNHNSSSEENMQNIPKKIGKPPHQYNIKRVFISTHPDLILVNADAKAAEVRVYAAYSHDKALIAALNDGMDPHSFFASTVYNVDNLLKDIAPGQRSGVLETIGVDMKHAWNYADFEARDSIKKTDKVYGEQLDALRKNIKRVVFGILYGAAPKKIAGIVGIPDNQAQAIIKSLFDMFPSIKGYIRATKDQVTHLGIVETFLGRRRHLSLKNLPSIMRGRAERQAVNFKIQNTSAEMVLDVLCATDPVISNDFGGNMLNTVHDSLVFQIPKKYVHQMPAFIQDYGVKQVAQKFPWLPVPFSWDVEVGNTYGDLMPVNTFLSDHPELAKSDNDDDDYLDLEIRNALAAEGAAEQSAA
jgi:DNA polymerase I-like protein with 3'-5' exonuclease and polymerase domains